VSACTCPSVVASPSLALQRLRQRAQFDAVLASAPAARTMHFALHLADPGAASAPDGLFPGGGRWLGVMVPKRWAKRAVTRNLLRRQIYEIGRELSGNLPAAAMVVRLRSGFSRQQFPSASSKALKRQARQELLQLFGRQNRA
jgi:ribonuclease P protein component